MLPLVDQETGAEKNENLQLADGIDADEAAKIKDFLEGHGTLESQDYQELRDNILAPVQDRIDDFSYTLSLERSLGRMAMTDISLTHFDHNLILLVQAMDHMQNNQPLPTGSPADNIQQFLTDYADTQEMQRSEDLGIEDVVVYDGQITMPSHVGLFELDDQQKENLEQVQDALKLEKVGDRLRNMGRILIDTIRNGIATAGNIPPHDTLDDLGQQREKAINANEDAPGKAEEKLGKIVQELAAIDQKYDGGIIEGNSMLSTDTTLSETLSSQISDATDPTSDFHISQWIDALSGSHDMVDNIIEGATGIDTAGSKEIASAQINGQMDMMLQDSDIMKTLSGHEIPHPYTPEDARQTFTDTVESFFDTGLFPGSMRKLTDTLMNNTDLQTLLKEADQASTKAIATSYMDKLGFNDQEQKVVVALSHIMFGLKKVPDFAQSQADSFIKNVEQQFSFADTEASFKQYVTEVELQKDSLSDQEYEKKIGWIVPKESDGTKRSDTIQAIISGSHSASIFAEKRDAWNNLDATNKQWWKETCDTKIADVTNDKENIVQAFAESSVAQLHSKMVRQYAKGQPGKILDGPHTASFTKLQGVQKQIESDMTTKTVSYYTSEALVFAASCASGAGVARFSAKYAGLALRMMGNSAKIGPYIQRASQLHPHLKNVIKVGASSAAEGVGFGATYGAMRSAGAKNRGEVGKNISENAMANVGYYRTDALLAGTLGKFTQKVIKGLKGKKISLLKQQAKGLSKTKNMTNIMKQNLDDIVGQFSFLKKSPGLQHGCKQVFKTVIDAMSSGMSLAQMYAKHPGEMIMLQTLHLAEKGVKVADEFVRVLLSNSIGYRAGYNMTQVMFGPGRIEDVFDGVLPTQSDIEMTTVLMLGLPTQKYFAKAIDKGVGVFTKKGKVIRLNKDLFTPPKKKPPHNNVIPLHAAPRKVA